MHLPPAPPALDFLLKKVPISLCSSSFVLPTPEVIVVPLLFDLPETVADVTILQKVS